MRDLPAKCRRVLVLSVALNGYERVYRRCLASHERYARRYGYTHVCVTRPRWLSVTESAWLKIPLMLEGLRAGFDWVMFVDADCEIRPDTPAVTNLEEPRKELYMGLGFSGRLNSGVIIVRSGKHSIALLQQIFDACQDNVPGQDWGENGHLIHFVQDHPALRVLSIKWNNNADPDCIDFIRHYSAGGPMRDLLTTPWWMTIYQQYARLRCRIRGKRYIDRVRLKQQLQQTMDRVTRWQPALRTRCQA